MNPAKVEVDIFTRKRKLEPFLAMRAQAVKFVKTAHRVAGLNLVITDSAESWGLEGGVGGLSGTVE